MYIPEYKLAREVDELGHCTRDLKSVIELGGKFIRFDP